MIRPFSHFIIALCLLFQGVAACADDTTPPAGTTASTTTNVSTAPTRAELTLFALGLIGSVYRPGGDTPQRGMDCSGFVRYVYQQVAGLKLPHNAAAMSKVSDVINKADLKPGDLVFFNTVKKAISHVGIYLGNNQFIHASSSTSGAVMVSNLNDSYWQKHFDGARRLLHGLNNNNAPTTENAGVNLSESTSNDDPIANLIHQTTRH